MQQLTKPLQKAVFYDQDGSFDDFCALITLLSLQDYRITGMTITEAACNLDVALNTSLSILGMFCRYDIQLATSKPENRPHYLFDDSDCNKLPDIEQLMNARVGRDQVRQNVDAADFIVEKLLAEEDKTTYVLTGPATNLVNALEKHPEIKDKIEQVLWVAGAFLVDGNVVAEDHDGSAEKNIFHDTQAASELLKSGLKIVMFPLDLCKLIPVDSYLMYHLEKGKDKKVSRLVYEMLSPRYNLRKQTYIHDLLPVVYLGKPEIFRKESKAVAIEQRGTSKGSIYRTTLGSRIKHVSFVDEEAYNDFLIEQYQKF